MIYVECKPDRLVVRILAGIPKKRVRHAGNKSQVLKMLERTRMALGIVDEDPHSHQPPQILQSKDISTEEVKKASLRTLLYQDNVILVIRPRLEEWILALAKELGVDPAKHRLPEDPDELHEVINYNLDKFERLLLDIKRRGSTSARLTTFIQVIRDYRKLIRSQD